MLICPLVVDEHLRVFYYDCAAVFQQWSLRRPFRIAEFIISGVSASNTVLARRKQLLYLLKLFMYPDDLARFLVNSYPGSTYA